MLNVKKSEQPEFLIEYKENKANASYKNMRGEMRKDLRHYIAYREQCKSKRCFCAYCEREIVVNSDNANGSHIEHVKPQSQFPKSDLEYTNLIVSCNSKESCGIKKGNRYFEEFIDPVFYDPGKHFTYDSLTGEIIPKSGITNSNTPEYKTLALLGLNNIRLTEARKRFTVEVVSLLRFMKKSEIKHFVKQFPTLFEFLIDGGKDE